MKTPHKCDSTSCQAVTNNIESPQFGLFPQSDSANSDAQKCRVHILPEFFVAVGT